MVNQTTNPRVSRLEREFLVLNVSPPRNGKKARTSMISQLHWTNIMVSVGAVARLSAQSFGRHKRLYLLTRRIATIYGEDVSDLPTELRYTTFNKEIITHLIGDGI